MYIVIFSNDKCTIIKVCMKINMFIYKNDIYKMHN